MQLDRGVLWPGQAAATEYADRHVEIATELLAEHVGGEFRDAEQRVRARIDRHRLVDPVQPVGEVPSGFVLDQWQRVGPVAVDLVGAGEADRALWAKVARRHQKVEGADRVDVEIVVRDRRRLVVRGLRGGVDDEIRPLFGQQHAHGGAVANVDDVVPIGRQSRQQVENDRLGGALRAEEFLPHVVVHADDRPSLAGERLGAGRPDQATGTGYQYFQRLASSLSNANDTGKTMLARNAP